MNKKYLLDKVELHVGDTISINVCKETSLDMFENTVVVAKDVKVTSELLETLESLGLITVQNGRTKRNISYYVNKAGERLKCSNFTKFFTGRLIENYPEEAFNIILRTVAQCFKEEDYKAFYEAEEYFKIRLSDGALVKVDKEDTHSPIFKSIQDAMDAKDIIWNLRDVIYGK